MSKKKQFRSILIKASWWTTLLVGVAIGVVSQRIPEIKSYTDEFVQPIEKNKIFQELKAKIGLHLHYDGIDLANQQFPYSHYSEENPLPGHPISSFIIHRSGYSLAYDARTRNPAWVYEHITVDSLKGDVDRSHFSFKEDDRIPQHLRATLADYKGQGLDQGHMAPAANHRSSAEEMSDTFYLTNICPQCPQFNREYWSQLEKHVRDLTKEYRHVYVVTGPLYLPYNEGKRRFVKYQVIGPDEVAVPSHFFKVITLENWQGKREIRAYLLPNTFIPPNTPLDNFKTTAQKVERAAGLILFNQ
jgi:endonuclease G